MDWIAHLMSILKFISVIKPIGKSGHNQGWHTKNLSEFHFENEFVFQVNFRTGKSSSKFIWSEFVFDFEVQNRDF